MVQTCASNKIYNIIQLDPSTTQSSGIYCNRFGLTDTAYNASVLVLLAVLQKQECGDDPLHSSASFISYLRKILSYINYLSLLRY